MQVTAATIGRDIGAENTVEAVADEDKEADAISYHIP